MQFLRQNPRYTIRNQFYYNWSAFLENNYVKSILNTGRCLKCHLASGSQTWLIITIVWKAVEKYES